MEGRQKLIQVVRLRNMWMAGKPHQKKQHSRHYDQLEYRGYVGEDLGCFKESRPGEGDEKHLRGKAVLRILHGAEVRVARIYRRGSKKGEMVIPAGHPTPVE